MPTESQPQIDSPHEELDIEAQLDELLAQLEAVDPSLLNKVPGSTASGAVRLSDHPTNPQMEGLLAGDAVIADHGAEQVARASDHAAQAVSDETPQVGSQDQPDQAPVQPEAATEVQPRVSETLADQLESVVGAGQVAQVEGAAVDHGPDGVSEDPDPGPGRETTVPQTDTLTGQDLARQVDELLQDDQAVSREPIAVDAAPARVSDMDESNADASADQSDIAMQLEALLEGVDEPAEAADEPAQASERSVSAEPLEPVEAQNDPADDEAPELSVEQIDEMLAEEADDSVGDGLDIQAEPVAVGPGQPVPSNELAAVDDREPVDVESDPTQPVGGGFDADAAAVAQELDAQPEHRSAVADQTPKPAQRPRRADRRLSKERVLAQVEVCEVGLRRFCGLINTPVRNLPRISRDLIGYVGLAHLLIGVLLVFGRMLTG